MLTKDFDKQVTFGKRKSDKSLELKILNSAKVRTCVKGFKWVGAFTSEGASSFLEGIRGRGIEGYFRYAIASLFGHSRICEVRARFGEVLPSRVWTSPLLNSGRGWLRRGVGRDNTISAVCLSVICR